MPIRKRIQNPQTGELEVGTVVDVVEITEPMTKFTLADGAIVHMRLTINEVLRMDNPGPDGKPSYNFNANMATTVHFPEDQADG